jgi:hypothetical protein
LLYDQPSRIEKVEVIKEVPVFIEKIVTVEKIVEVPVEKIIIQTVEVEKPIIIDKKPILKNQVERQTNSKFSHIMDQITQDS